MKENRCSDFFVKSIFETKTKKLISRKNVSNRKFLEIFTMWYGNTDFERSPFLLSYLHKKEDGRDRDISIEIQMKLDILPFWKEETKGTALRDLPQPPSNITTGCIRWKFQFAKCCQTQCRNLKHLLRLGFYVKSILVHDTGLLIW